MSTRQRVGVSIRWANQDRETAVIRVIHHHTTKAKAVTIAVIFISVKRNGEIGIIAIF